MAKSIGLGQMRQKPVAAEPMTGAKTKGIAAPPQPAGKNTGASAVHAATSASWNGSLDTYEGISANQSQRENGDGEKLAHVKSPEGWRISAAAVAIGAGGGRILDTDEGDAASQSQREEGEGEKLAHLRTPEFDEQANRK